MTEKRSVFIMGISVQTFCCCIKDDSSPKLLDCKGPFLKAQPFRSPELSIAGI